MYPVKNNFSFILNLKRELKNLKHKIIDETDVTSITRKGLFAYVFTKKRGAGEGRI